jgi:C1A family cysteine protease
MSKKYNLKFESGMYPEKIVNYSVTTSLPNKIDLRSKLNITYDQGNLGSCTANALCYSFIFNDPTFSPSRLFLYYNERVLDNNIINDDGSTLSQGINALTKYGVCSENNCPYIISKFKIKPSNISYTEGLDHQIISASRVLQTLDSLKGCLKNNQPFVVGILVYSSFESLTTSKTGYVSMPNVKKEQLLGGHAVTCVGYDDTKQVWIMKNSWGTNWGDNGNFYLPYNYLLNTSLAGDIWKITQVEIVKKITPPNIKKIINSITENVKHLKNYNK